MNLSLLSKFFLISLFSFQTIFSQNQVQWSAQARQTDDSTYDVVINASIIDNWKLYSTDLPEGGPLPTVLKWKKSTQIEKLQTSLPKSGYDPIFLMELSIYYLHFLAYLLNSTILVKMGHRHQHQVSLF